MSARVAISDLSVSVLLAFSAREAAQKWPWGHLMRRGVTREDLMTLGQELSRGERELIETLARLGLMTHAQLASLIAAGSGVSASRARAVRRALKRLAEQRVISRLERRIGGRRAGSSGFVYYLGPVGQRLVAFWQGQGAVRGRVRPEPGGRYVRHRLAVSQLYVRLRAAATAGTLELLSFQAEPECWRTMVDGLGGRSVVKPDAFVRLGLGAYEDSFFIEVDLGSESRTVLAAKAKAYVRYFHTGAEQAEHGVFPRVVFLVSSEHRKSVVVDVCSRLPAEDWTLFSVGTLERALQLLTGEIDKAVRLPDGGAEL